MKNKKFSNGSEIKDGKITGTVYLLMTPGKGFYTKNGYIPTMNLARAHFFDRNRAEKRKREISHMAKSFGKAYEKYNNTVFMIPVPINIDFNELSFVASLAQDNQEAISEWIAENQIVAKKD